MATKPRQAERTHPREQKPIQPQRPSPAPAAAPQVAPQRAAGNQREPGPTQILTLQRTVGNRRVQRALGPAHDELQAKDSSPAVTSVGSAHPALHPSPLTSPEGAALQREVLLPAHSYGPDVPGEPEIRTSDNFDKNHLVHGPTTQEVAEAKRQARGNPERNTVVSLEALKREVTNNDLDLTRGVATDAITTYSFKDADEARTASNAGVLWSPTVGVKARRAGQAVEIHHLHESGQSFSPGDFPALGSAPPGKGKKRR